MLADPAIQVRIDELVTELLPLARAEAWRVWQRAPHALELDELEALALTGLAQAAARFPRYNEEHGYAPDDFRYFKAYCLRRMRGAITDAMRSQDWVTRSARTRAKQLREAGQDQGRTEEELSAASGLSITEVRDTLAAVSSRPVSIDAEPHDVQAPDDVEGQAVVSAVLGVVTGVLDNLPPVARTVVILRYYYGLSITEVAAAAGVKPEEAVQLHSAAVLAVHDAMLRAVT